MHDTLADVLRGKVDHPIVGDIRMLAQEMGVTGRLNVEKQALTDGWEHVKAEYEVDNAGGLEPLIAYAYFAAKNFGVQSVEQLALNLANEHIETPLSQGLFAIIGPITETSEVAGVSAAFDSAEPPSALQVDAAESPLPPTVSVEDGLGKLVKEKIGAALGEDTMKDLDVPGGLKGLGTMIRAAVDKAKEDPEVQKGISELENLDLKGLPKSVSKYIESAMSGVGADIEKSRRKRRDKFQQLEELLQQDSVKPSRLSRAIRKASLRATVLSDSKRLKNPQNIGELMKEGAKRLVLLDSMEYIDILDEIYEGLIVTVGEFETARIITETTSEIDVTHLDEKNRKFITKVFDNGVKRSAKLGDFKSFREFFSGKWKLLGIGPKDMSTVANQVGKLMGYGRTTAAFELLSSFIELFKDSQYENSIGLTLQAFKGLSKAKVSEREEIKKIVNDTMQHLDKRIEWMKTKEILSQNESAAELCVFAVSSTISMMETYVKSSGKAVAAESVYPLLHEILKPLVINAVEALKTINLEKFAKTMLKMIEKLKGASESKVEMVKATRSLLS
jgi:hypothetical protein